VNGGFRSALFACVVLLTAHTFTCEAQAARDEFFFAPWSGQYYRPAWRPRYYAPPRKRKAIRSAQRRNLTHSRKRQRVALAVPRSAMRKQSVGSESGKRPVQQSVNCEKAQATVSEFGFKEIKAEVCGGATLHFSATRDGKPFSIQIVAANGEFAKVQRQR
jgi:hypothetical protein